MVLRLARASQGRFKLLPMQCVMLALCHHTEIVQCVVSGVVVNVMNHLRFVKVSPQMLFHNKAVNHDVPLAVGMWVRRNTKGQVSVFPAVVDRLLGPCFAFGMFDSALNRTIFLRAVASVRNVCMAVAAMILRGRAEPSHLFALPRAHSLGPRCR